MNLGIKINAIPQYEISVPEGFDKYADAVMHILHNPVVNRDCIFSHAREFIVLEAKGPQQSLDMQTVDKGSYYAYSFIFQKNQIGGMATRDNTCVMICRQQKPEGLFRMQGKEGIDFPGKGIYGVKGRDFLILIAVTGEIDGRIHPCMKCMSRNAEPQDLQRMEEALSEYLEEGEYQDMARKVLGVAVAGNRKAYEELRKKGGANNMKEDLRFVFEEEFEDYDKQLKEKEEENKIQKEEYGKQLKEKEKTIKEKDEVINNFIKMLSDSLGMETLKNKILQSDNRAMVAEYNKIMRTL